jgi:hypothetical protein
MNPPAWLAFVIVNVLALGSALAQTSAPPAAPPTLAAARARMQAKDAEGAVEILTALVEREPKNAAAWRSLGGAYQALADYDMAAEALQQALEVQPSDPATLYNLGVVRALAGDTDGAFEWLMEARRSRRIDMTQIDFDAQLARLKSDPRFAGLHPEAKDFAEPFVEPVKILREWDGEAANDQFGWIARSLGDVDGDGVPDVVTSATTHGRNGAGRVYAYSTKSGKLLWSADGQPGDQLGTGVEGAGDTNKDGVPDVIASAPGSGKAFVYSGRDGRVLLTLQGESVSDTFGRHASGAGDVDHDGYADVIVGAPGNSAAGAGAGRAYVFSGKDGHALLTLSGEHAQDGFGSSVTGSASATQLLLVVGAGGAGEQRTGRAYVYDALTNKPKFTIEADATGVGFAQMFVAIPGDVDGDGADDVFASDWLNAALGPQTGRVYVHSGKDGRNLLTLTGETAGDGFGSSHSIAGDVDGDGHADLIVGAWQFSGAAVGAGKAYLHSGADGRLLASYTCRTPGDTFGFDAVALGDTDGDGTSDLLITSGWSGVHGYHSGRVFLISSGIAKRAR